jgi:hypothetical protein
VRLSLVGADPRDDEDLRAGKALLVLISVLILSVAALWGALYLSFGSWVGLVPLVYFAVLLAALVVFSRTRDFPWLLRVGQVDILLAPTLSMIPLGGFLDAGGVGFCSDARTSSPARNGTTSSSSSGRRSRRLPKTVSAIRCATRRAL